MSALITTRYPTSYQLRSTAVNCRKYPSPSVFLRMHVHKLDHQIRCFSGPSDNVNERRRSNYTVYAFSGWSGDDNGTEVLNESPKKKGWSGGIMGAAVAGVVLVGGLAFATVSISRRASGTKKNVETLTMHQEESLTSVDQNDNVEHEKTETKSDVVDNSLLEDNTSKDDDSISSEKNEEKEKEKEKETVIDNELDDNIQDELPAAELQKSDADNDSNLNEDLVTEKFESESINNIQDDTNDDVKIIDTSISDVNSVNPDTGYPDVNDTAINGSNSSSLPSPVILEPEIDPIITSKTKDFENKETFVSEESDFDLVDLEKITSSASNPAPSVLSPALKGISGKVLVPAVVDQVQGQALAALQVFKVIEGDVEPGDLCTRREYARWLVSASSALSRNTLSKVYPAMYIENVTELAFDDITPQDPDFSSIQGLAEAGLIASKLSQRDMDISHQIESSLDFCPDSPLSRQDLVSWKMSLEKRLLPVADRMILQQLSGFIDIDKINKDAWPALIADLSEGENGIIGLAFGYTRLFQPDKPVTKGQAAIALATGEASETVSEELTRIEAESMAEKAVAEQTALIDQLQKEVNTNYENDLLQEREKIIKLEKIAEETRQELQRLKTEQEEQNIKMIKERAAVDSQMEVLSKLRREAEEELNGIMSDKVEIFNEKEKINKIRTDAEIENREILRLQYELEVERKALAMARSWAEDEAKRAREQAKVLEDARDVWESKGIKVIVDKDLENESNTQSTWVNAQEQSSIEGRAETLVDKLKSMAAELKGKSKQVIDTIIEKVQLFISRLKELTSKGVKQVGEVKDGVVVKVNGSIQDLQESSVGLKEGVKRVVGDCREGVEKLTQKFKT